MEISYRRYRQYRANRHQYKVDQIAAPIVMMLIIGFITEYWVEITIVTISLIWLRISSERKQNRVKKQTVDSMCVGIEERQNWGLTEEELDAMNSTELGYVNKNKQRNNGRTEIPGTGNGQWFYDMECLECGHKYHANGHDIWLRKCPECQGKKQTSNVICGQKSTDAGYVNKNNQKNNGKTDIPGTGNGQWFYDMECLECGHKYHANGHDIWLRKCPECQGGRP